MNETDWNLAEPITDFFRVEPEQGGKINTSTEVRILYDDKNLYFGIFAKDSLGKKDVRMQDLSRDFNGQEHDVLEFKLMPKIPNNTRSLFKQLHTVINKTSRILTTIIEMRIGMHYGVYVPNERTKGILPNLPFPLNPLGMINLRMIFRLNGVSHFLD